MKKNELNYKDLRVMCNPNFFDFETTVLRMGGNH